MLLGFIVFIAIFIGSIFLGGFLGGKLTLVGLTVVMVLGIISIWLIGRNNKASFDRPDGPMLVGIVYSIFMLLFVMTISALIDNRQYIKPHIDRAIKILVK